MPLINRFARLFSADLHALLDRIEEPDVLLKQAIREMEDALDDRRLQIVRCSENVSRLQNLEAEAQSQVDEANAELDICFESDEHSLARSVLKRKLETEHRLRALVAKREETELSLQNLNARLADDEAELITMRQKAEAYTERPAAKTSAPIIAPDYVPSDEDLDVAFLREQHRRKQS